MVPSERRQHPRKTINLPLTLIVNGTALAGDLVDISRGGLRLHALAKLKLQSRARVEMRVVPHESCVGEGEIVRIGSHGDFGVEFDSTSSGLADFIDDLVQLRAELQTRLLRSVMQPTIFIDTLS